MLSAVLCAVVLGQVVLGEGPQVTTSQGTMRGQVLQSRGGRDYFSFTKIPYAKPPLGERRFVMPEKSGNWSGVLDATQPTPSCFQGRMFQNTSQPGFSGEEDCLYLNVFTPNITGSLPVIFHIHGGAFKIGSAGELGSAKDFMDEDVVFVAPNYRLGTLGFLSFEDDVLPGNLGLKDQALALEWVDKEISAFGGDPNLITVVGGSAGGVSSHLICDAPRTNGLIKGCISQSGDGWASWAIMERGRARKMAVELANQVGCNNQTGTQLLKCLQGKPIQFVGDVGLIQNTTESLSILSPVLEPATAPGALLTSWPSKANHNYPRILGVVQDEGMMYTFRYEFNLASKEEKANFINSFNDTITKEYHLEKRTSDLVKIRQRFFTEGIDPLIAIRNFATEYLWIYPAMKSLKTHPGPTYFYKFNYTKGPPSPFHSDHPGVPHGAEGPYFNMGNSDPSKPSTWPTPEDVKLSKLLVKMWVNFARNQTPSSKGMELQWSQFQGQYFLDIQDSGVSVGNFTQYHDILNFWESIFPSQTSNSSPIQSSIIFVTALIIFTAFKELFC